jgi:hypothetical protein
VRLPAGSWLVLRLLARTIDQDILSTFHDAPRGLPASTARLMRITPICHRRHKVI